MELSPAVERARDAAIRRAADRGDDTPTLADWFDVLLDDDDGHPAGLLVRLDVAVDDARAFAADHLPHQLLAPPPYRLLARGRDLSAILRADPTVTTEFLFLAVVEAAEMQDGGFAHLGASLGRIADLYGQGEPIAPVETEAFAVDLPADLAATNRILDASLNRARESLRVLDDYARFALNDRVLTEEFKALRHRLVAAVRAVPGLALLASRDTPGDVGTTVTAGKEYVRSSPRESAGVNAKRLQEALRSVEEYGKPFGERFAREIESIRYASYTLESALLGGSALRDQLTRARLYVLLTGSQCTASVDWTIREAAAGGAQVFQLREKGLNDRDLLARAKLVRRVTRETGTLFVMNDRPDLARLADADGVHLGQDDLPVAAARAILGPDRLVGVSTHTIDQVRLAVLAGADYLGVGPVFSSPTKTFDAFPGTAFVRQAAEATALPCFALGGITPANVHEVIAAGVRRIAVASAVTTSDDPGAPCRVFRSHLGV
jgi:thiamine-phosphate pyrophosphorylase